MIGLFEDRALFEHRRGVEAAVESEGPIVVRALQTRAGTFTGFDDLRAAVRTGIDKDADLAVGAAQDDQRHAHEVEGEVIARLGHPAVVADAVPVAEEDPLAFALIEPRRSITPAGQGLGRVPTAAHARVMAGLKDIIGLKIRDHRHYPLAGGLSRSCDLSFRF